VWDGRDGVLRELRDRQLELRVMRHNVRRWPNVFGWNLSDHVRNGFVGLRRRNGRILHQPAF
jgi:hypothetical protein